MKALSIKSVFIAISIAMGLCFIESCVHDPIEPVVTTPNPDPDPTPDPEETCDPNVVYFENEILPLLVSNCAKSNCHDAASAQDGIILNSYSSIMNSDVIESFDANDSELYEKITETDSDDVMPPPPASRLTSTQIASIRNWINQGAKNNVCETQACDTTRVTYTNQISRILTNKCVGCHSGTTPSGNLNFTSHAVVQAVGLNGKLLGAIKHQPGFKPMPQGGAKLSTCEINTIMIWIKNGALNN